MGRNHSTRNAAIVVVLLIVAALYGNSQGWFSNLQTPTTGAIVSPGSSNNNSGSGLTAGDKVTVTVTDRDAVTDSALTEASAVDAVTYNKRADGGYTAVSGGASSSSILTSADNGLVSVGYIAHAAAPHYIFSPDKTSNSNAGLQTSCVYIDPTGAGTRKYICAYSTSGLHSERNNFGTTPTLAINAKYNYAGTGSLSSPSDISSIGTTANTIKTIEWQNSGTAGQNLYVTHVQLKVNSTSVAKWNAGDSYVTLGGQIMPLTTATSITNTGSSTIYEWTFGYTADKAKIITFANNALAKDYETTHLSLNLSTSDVLTWTWQVDTLKELDAQQSSLTDAVNTSA